MTYIGPILRIHDLKDTTLWDELFLPAAKAVLSEIRSTEAVGEPSSRRRCSQSRPLSP